MSDEEKQLHVRIPKDIYTRLKIKCAYEEISIQDYLARLIQNAMNSSQGDGLSLLIVDDEAIVRESLVDSMRDRHEVAAAGTAEEALKLLEERDFDVVITDVRLPGMSGVELVSEIRERKPYIKSIVITAYPSVELAVEAMKQGAIDYMVKPVSSDDLARVLERLDKTKDERGVNAAPSLDGLALS